MFEVLITLMLPYPGLNFYTITYQLIHVHIIPVSTYLVTLTFLRVFFIAKLFKHFTKYTSLQAEHICDKYVCKANSLFALKAMQKRNPFIVLTIMFALSCSVLGLSIRNFELYCFKLSLRTPLEDWMYLWNSFWMIFVTMTTGYLIISWIW